MNDSISQLTAALTDLDRARELLALLLKLGDASECSRSRTAPPPRIGAHIGRERMAGRRRQDHSEASPSGTRLRHTSKKFISDQFSRLQCSIFLLNPSLEA